ncbi:MAG: BspA family leucine-rich repeat surface protein [Bacillota bacterium]|nr:BspA family leucine-rich repeat surface protein [Bacillota bacterium]
MTNKVLYILLVLILLFPIASRKVYAENLNSPTLDDQTNDFLEKNTLDKTKFCEKLKAKTVRTIEFGKKSDFQNIVDQYEKDEEAISLGTNGNIFLYSKTEGRNTHFLVINEAEQLIYFPKDSSGLFSGLTFLKEISFRNVDTSRVEDMSSMFSKCKGLLNLDLSGLDTSRVKSMTGMFYGCGFLEEINFKNFNTANVESMSNMFFYCYKLKNLDLSSFNTSKVTTMASMFEECRGLTSLDLSSFYTPKLTQINRMFCESNNLKSINLCNFNTANVEMMSSIFKNCQALTSLDLSSFDTSKSTSFFEMFCGCSNLKTIYATKDFNTTDTNNKDRMFYKCSALVGGNGTICDSSKTGSTYAKIDRQGQEGYFTGCYNISLESSGNGELTASSSKATAGTGVTINLKADQGYEFDTWEVFPQGLEITKDQGENTYSFIMPAQGIKIKASFKKISADLPGEDEGSEQEQEPETWPEEPSEPESPDSESEEKDHLEENHLQSFILNYLFFSPLVVSPKAQDSKSLEPSTLTTETLINIGSDILQIDINGSKSQIKMDVKAYIKDGRTMLPIRFVGQALGFKVEWDQGSETVSLKNQDTLVEIPIQTKKIIVNGREFQSDIKPELKADRTMMPVANIARALGLKDGAEISWDPVSQKVTIIRTVVLEK